MQAKKNVNTRFILSPTTACPKKDGLGYFLNISRTVTDRELRFSPFERGDLGIYLTLIDSDRGHQDL